MSARPPHGGFIRVHLVSGPRDGHVVSFQGDVQGPAFVPSNGHACQRRIHVDDGADGGAGSQSDEDSKGEVRWRRRCPDQPSAVPNPSQTGTPACASWGWFGFRGVWPRCLQEPQGHGHPTPSVHAPQQGQIAARWSSRPRSPQKAGVVHDRWALLADNTCTSLTNTDAYVSIPFKVKNRTVAVATHNVPVGWVRQQMPRFPPIGHRVHAVRGMDSERGRLRPRPRGRSQEGCVNGRMAEDESGDDHCQVASERSMTESTSSWHDAIPRDTAKARSRCFTWWD